MQKRIHYWVFAEGQEKLREFFVNFTNNEELIKTLWEIFKPKSIGFEYFNREMTTGDEVRFSSGKNLYRIPSLRFARDVYDKIPEGWIINTMAQTTPIGFYTITNNESFFSGLRKSGIIRIEDAKQTLKT